jgi:RND superfamily putative drug exporter
MRLTVVPALLALLGERSWAMPVWLDRILPKLTIEPPTDQPTSAPGVEERPIPVT